MSTPLIGALRESNPLMRSTTLVVLIAFVTLLVQPTIAAATDTTPVPTTTTTSTSAEAQYSKTLQRIEDKLARLENKLTQQLDGTLERNDLKQLEQTLKQLDQTVRQGFHQVEQHITDKNLATVIMQRHQAMVSNYQAEYQALIDELDAIDAATDDSQRKQHAQAALNRLKQKKNKRSHQPFDPNQLPNSTLKPDPNNTPKETEAAFTQAGLYNTPYQNIAALGDFTFDKLADASNPAYLAETVEVTLTQAIKDKAAELNHDPVKIYHWVRNTVEWMPTWGGIQDADLTLSSQRGNAMDIASLTIALLRASKIPARYVHGTIDVPAAQFMNWMGNFTNINAAADYAASGGIPVTSLISGGQIKKIRMEHLWVEAAIDYHPSKGAINKDADSWVQMDPSYKQYEYLTGLDTLAISEIDPQVLAQSFVDSGTVNETESWVTGFNPAILETAQNQAKQKLETHIQNNLTDPTVGDVIGDRKTIIKDYPVLPSSLPNKVLIEGVRYAELPNQLKYRLTLELFNSSNNQALGSPALSYTLPLSKIGTRRLSITYQPTSQADSDALQSQIDSGVAELSIYLISLKPVVSLDESELISGSGIAMGSDQLLDVIIHSPQSNYRMSYSSQIAGDEMVISTNGGGIDFNQVTARAQSVVTDSAGENLHRVGLNYWAEADFITDAMASFLNTQATRLPSVGLLSSPLSVVYNFGIPRIGYYFQRSIDIKRNVHAIGTTDQALRKDFLLQTGLAHSYLESSIFEQVLHYWHGTGASTAQILVDANQQQIPIYLLNKTNMSTLLSELTISSDVLLDIQNAVNAGLEVIIPKRQPDKPVGYAAMGYMLFDPITGAGSYRISGGLDGGGVIGPCQEAELQSLKQAMQDKILTYTVLAELAIIGYGLGGLVGGAAPELAPVLAQLMAAVGLSALTFDATAGGLCNVLGTKRGGGNSDGAVRSGLCADLVINTVHQGQDSCLNGVDFDAWTISTVWEVKVINFSKSQEFIVDSQIENKDLKQLARQKAALAGCPQYQHGWAVADLRHFTRQKAPYGWDLLVNIHRHVPECFLITP